MKTQRVLRVLRNAALMLAVLGSYLKCIVGGSWMAGERRILEFGCEKYRLGSNAIDACEVC